MIFRIALKDLKIIFKDRKALATMLLMPILIIFILGSALSNMFSNDVAVKKFSIAVVNRDNKFLSQIFIDNVLKKAGRDMFSTSVVDENDAKSLLSKKKATSVITIPENFTQDIENNQPVKINIESLTDDKIKANIVESYTKGFAQSISLNYAGAFAVVDEMKKYGLPLPAGVNGYSQADMIIADLEKKISTEAFRFSEQEQEKNKSISAIQYYSASMLLMFILFGANMGMMLLIEERETKTLGRIITTGVGKGTLIIGKFLGLLLICLAQSTILILFTRLAYGVFWGGTLADVAIVTFCSVFAGAAMGMFIASVSKTPKTAQSFSQIFIQLSTILGGGMIPIYVMPKLLQHFSKVTVNFWGTKGFLDLMLGSGMNTVFQYCGILVAMGIVYLTIGILKFRVE